MKRACTYFALLMMLLLQSVTLLGQGNIQVTVVPRTTMFPATGLSYLDDPEKYFTILMTNLGSETQSIYLGLSINCEFSNTGSSFGMQTDRKKRPNRPLTLAAGQTVQLTQALANDVFSGYSASDLSFTGATGWQDVLMLPEGQYKICVTPYVWQENAGMTEPLLAGEQGCCMFNICYSGSAPEFVTPIVGQGAGNFNVPDPRSQDNATTSDNRAGNSYAVVAPTRNLNFRWTGVVSNCLPPYYFDYVMKIVELLPGQNAEDAIRNNPTLGTINNGNRTSYTHDTTRNLNFRLSIGKTYVAQVTAVLNSRYQSSIVSVSNNGASQIIVFTWGESASASGSDDVANRTPTVSYSHKDNREDVLKTIREQYVISPGLDSATSSAVVKKADTVETVPACTTPYDVNESGYRVYRVPKSNEFQPGWTHVRGDSVVAVEYNLTLYKYIGGNISNSMAFIPVAQRSYSITNRENFAVANETPFYPLEDDMYQIFEEGEQYLMTVDAVVNYKYSIQTTITTTEFVNDVETMREEKLTTPAMGVSTSNSFVVFAWGVDSGLLKQATPAEITYPDNCVANDEEWEEIIEVEKRSDFSIAWRRAEGISIQDTALYDLYIFELKKGKTIEQTLKGDTLCKIVNMVDLSCEEQMMRDSLKEDKQYLAYVLTHAKYNGHKYNINNGGRSKYLTFKMIKEIDYNAMIDSSRQCHPEYMEGLDTANIITPDPKELIDNKKRLMMGKFPLVMQEATKDDKKKTYSGKGYVVWRPTGVEVWVKVRFDSIQINKDYKIISGTAKGIREDSTNYVVLDFDAGWTDWTDKNLLNKAASICVDNSTAKKYYDEVNKYSSIVQGVRGIFSGDPLSVGVCVLPLSLDESVTKCKDFKTAIGEMYFTPTTALMNIQAIFGSNSDQMYVPFVATNICMNPTAFFEDMENGIDLYLAKTLERDLKDGYKLRMKRATQLGNPKDGTFVQLLKKDSTFINLDCELELNTSKIYKVDMKNNGTVMHQEKVKVYFSVMFTDWNDWVTRISMDPFAVSGMEDYTFIPTGKGIFYDHSTTRTPKDIKLPKGVSEYKDFDKWTGFYLDRFAMLFPDDISNTFADLSSDTVVYKDSIKTYTYGINGTIKDSSHYYYNGSRISAAAEHLVLDSYGVSADFVVTDILKAATDKAGGWSFSIDTVGISIVKSEFKDGRIAGSMGMPLFSGTLGYSCVLGIDNFEFKLFPRGDKFALDLWAASIDLKTESSHFAITSKKEVEKTMIDLTLNGTINVDFGKISKSLDGVEFAAVKFEDMYVRNYTSKEVPETSGQGGGKGKKKLDYEFNGLAFDMGTWSKASPQKRLGAGSDAMTKAVYAEDKKNKPETVFSGNLGGFTYNVYTLSPIFEDAGSGKKKCGISVSGDMGIGIGNSQGISAGAGFAFWAEVNMKTYDVGNWGGRLDSIMIETDLEMFYLKGTLRFFKDDEIYGDGIRGDIKCSIMSDKVEFGVAAGFGTVKVSDGDSYDWWYLEGVANCKPGIPMGPISLTGLGGGFAYNMKLRDNCMDIDPRELRKANSDAGFVGQMVSSGMEFKPSRKSWVAKAGVAIALADPDMMNASGVLTLRMANGHFSGICLQVDANVIAHYNKETDESSNVTLKVGALIDYSQDSLKRKFVFTARAESNIDLTSFLKDNVPVPSIPCDIKYPYMGSDLVAFIEPEIGKGMENAEKEGKTVEVKAANTVDTTVVFGGGIGVTIPIDLYVTNYRNGAKGPVSGKKTEWYFSIGSPALDDRVKFEITAGLGPVFKASAKFTIYFATGNYFPDGYALPDLPDEVKEFLGDKYEKAQSGRKIPTFENVGGFAMGASFEAEVKFDFFLYVDVYAALGFDVALLDVNGQGCDEHDHIGKNDFYALGQVYAMLKGDIGLSLNLGFWKGKISLLEMGVGALLQGGAPNPTWAYGLLRMKCKVLDGLIKINTSVDFALGDVCVPGAGDPLANVHLFEKITPGFSDLKDAQKEENIKDPLAMGCIVSNMSWNEEVILVTDNGKGESEKDARKFIFKLDESQCKYQVSSDFKATKFQGSAPAHPMTYRRNESDENAMIFECEDGGFEPSKIQSLTLSARAYEYRFHCDDCKNAEDDYPIDITNFRIKDAKPKKGEMDWFNPIYDDGRAGKRWKPFQIDTTIYFGTTAVPEGFERQVVYTWPYNGDPSVPIGEIGNSVSVYIYKDRSDVYGEEALKQSGRELKGFIVEQDVTETEEGTPCTLIKYFSTKYNDVPIFGATAYFPNDYFDDESRKGKIYAVQFMLVNSEQYLNEVDNLMAQLQDVNTYQNETQGRDLNHLIEGYTYSETTSSSSGASSHGRGGTGSFSSNLAAKIDQIEREIAHDVMVSNINDRNSSHRGNITLPSTGSAGGGITLPGTGSGTGGGTTLPSTGGSVVLPGTSSGTGLTGSGLGLVGTLSGSVLVTGVSSVGGSSLNQVGNLNGNLAVNNTITNQNVQMGAVNASVSKNLRPSVMGGAKAAAAEGRQHASVSGNATASSNMMAMFSMTSGNTTTTDAVRSTERPKTANQARQMVQTRATTLSTNSRLSGNTISTSATSSETTLQRGNTVGINTGGTVQSGEIRTGSGRVLSPEGATNTMTIVTSNGSSDGSLSSLFTTNALGGVGISHSSYGTTETPGDDDYINIDDYDNDIRRAQAMQGVEAYNQFGTDTMMDYKRRFNVEYQAAMRSGSVFYTLYFQTDPTYNKYAEIFSAMDDGYFDLSSRLISDCKYAAGCITSKVTQSSRVFERYAYLFDYYTPTDPNIYQSGVKLPPIAVFQFDKSDSKNTNNEAMMRHKAFSNRCKTFLKVLDQTPIVEKYHRQNIYSPVNPYQFLQGYSDFKLPSTAWQKEYAKKISPTTTSDDRWQRRGYRQSTIGYGPSNNGTDEFLESNIYNQGGCWWIPNIISLRTPNKYVPRIDETFFSRIDGAYKTATSWSFNNSTDADKHAQVVDYATPAIYDDLSKFHSFFQTCIGYATYFYYKMSYLHKCQVIGELYKDEQMQQLLDFEGFPYHVKSVMLPIQYFHFFNGLKDANMNDLNDVTFEGAEDWRKGTAHISSFPYLYVNSYNNGNSLSVSKEDGFSMGWLFFNGSPVSWKGETGCCVKMFDDAKTRQQYVDEWYTSTKQTDKGDRLQENSSQKYQLSIAYYPQPFSAVTMCRVSANSDVTAAVCPSMSRIYQCQKITYTYYLPKELKEKLDKTNKLENMKDKTDNYDFNY